MKEKANIMTRPKRFITTIEIEADKYVFEDELRDICEYISARMNNAKIYNFLTYREEFIPGTLRGSVVHDTKEEHNGEI